jgi:diadenosine tetraphosphate (Ap4A) HIT family hydrolase
MMPMKLVEDLPLHIDECDRTRAPWRESVRQTANFIVFEDAYPVTEGHLLVVPTYNDRKFLMDAFTEAVRIGQDRVATGEWDGFNIGMNYGEAAGQTVAWPHVHLIPRRYGDIDNPRGGVRNTIPGRGDYRKPHVQD